MAKASCCPRWMMEYKGASSYRESSKLDFRIPYNRGKTQNALGSLRILWLSKKHNSHMLGQGEDEGIGKTLGFSMSLNHGKGFQMSINHVSVDFRGTGTLMPPRLPSHLSSLLISVSAPFFKWLLPT